MHLHRFTTYHFILLLVCLGISFNTWAQEKNFLDEKISIQLKNRSINAALKLLEEKVASINFVFDESKIPLDHRVNLTFKNQKLGWVLEQVLAGTPIDFKVFGSQITLFNNPKKVQPAPPQYTISGYLVDEKTQDPLIGATIFEPITSRGTTTNIEGFYSLTLPKGKHQIICSYIGYQSVSKVLDLSGNVKLNLNLDAGEEMEEVVVESSKHSDSRHDLNVISSHTMDIETIKSLPSMLGEVDVIKAMQLLPGVQSGSEGASGLFVRGGGPDQNLFLIDGAPVYNANHLFGFVSIFDSKIVKKATIIKGGFPARYGGRLSSVLDIHTRTGDMQKFHGEVSIGLLSAGASIEGPIWKGKTSFLITGRRSWVDLFGVPIQQAIVDNNGGVGNVINYSFYDINVKLKHKFSDKNYLVLSGYFGDDFLDYKQTDNLKFKMVSDSLSKYIQNNDKLQWGNKIVSLHWHSELNHKLFMTLTANYSNYFYESSTSNYALLKSSQNYVYQEDEFESEGRTPIHDIGAKVNFDYVPHNKHYIRFGLGYTHHLFRPEISKSTFSFMGGGNENELNTFSKIHEFNAFIEDDIRIGKVLKINPGIHIADFLLEGKNYFSVQPRLSINLLAAKYTSIKASYSRMTQFVHLLTNPGIGLPTDLWLPTTEDVPPEHSHQWTLGLTQDFPFDLEFTLEGFYKIMENLLEYNPSTNFLQNKRSWESLVEIGRGTSYGAEVMLQRSRGKFTGWVTYTLSWSWRMFERINRGNPFPYRYDRRHDVSIALNYKFNDNWDVGVVWVYGTGHPVTLGLERYTPIQTQMDMQSGTFSTGAIISDITNIVDRNNFRMPAYHRMDITVNWHKKLKHGAQTLSLGVYNVYNQLNPYMVVPREQADGSLKLFQISILPIMPSISYTRSW
ncbi:TonB-dependent receptor [Aureispira anguillae]|uniref:TonB-dependent receptor n=1 Tax=Aureispira anguillae TaxID=2864201 RepID=A0A916DUX6_9BACT|nr:TonB-dependent receptor [Aureispira anguillae]BDS12925.1 TonB-dependent receptor [Aureispira anguillae]